MAEDTEDKKLALQVEKQAARVEKVTNEKKEMELALTETKTELQAVEEQKDKLAKEKDRNEKKLKKSGGRVDRVASDTLGSGLAQGLSLAQQALIDALIDKFPAQVGKYRVLLKSFPPFAAMIWYLVEVAFMRETVKLPKAIRLSAANTLQNLGFVYLAQAWRADQSDKKEKLAEQGQTVAEMSAELAKAKKLLKEKGIDLDEGSDNG